MNARGTPKDAVDSLLIHHKNTINFQKRNKMKKKDPFLKERNPNHKFPKDNYLPETKRPRAPPILEPAAAAVRESPSTSVPAALGKDCITVDII